MAPGPDGSLFVSIPRPGGSVLTLLDRSGAPRPGWPITVKASTECGLLAPVDDGSVRLVCTMENPEGNEYSPIGAFAFDASGRMLAGWPVDLEGYFSTGRVVGTGLNLYASRSLGDVIPEGQPSSEALLMTIAADGTLRNGSPVSTLEMCCNWAVGPDGVAYGAGSGEAGQIGAVDLSGVRPGWPVSFDGFASTPAFGSGGRIVLTVGSPTRRTSEVLVFDRAGDAIRDRSAAIPIVTIDDSWGDTGGCPPSPQPPVVASDGTIVLYSEADDAVFALDSSLEILSGWPYRPATPLILRDERYVKEDAYCPWLAVPAVGPDSTLHLPLQARDSTVGGSLIAVGPDGRVRPGWPVGLRRPGSEFWSVAVGPDGIAYALAIEPESSATSSASVLAIAPDSTVLYTTTIVEP